jgi:hypothetical protein
MLLQRFTHEVRHERHSGPHGGAQAPAVVRLKSTPARQVCVLLRLLTGKLHEAWELFKHRVQADRPLAAKYVRQLDDDGATALDKLKKHFGKGSPLTEIRNKIAFHYNDCDNLAEQS